jgi:hypothetical protein
MTDDEIKQNVLLGTEKLKPLALEVARRDLLRLYGGDHGGELQARILCEGTVNGIDTEKKKAVAKTFYYHAKNIVYGADNYYDELRKVQTRIDFSRSYLTVSALLIPITLLLSVFSGFTRRHAIRTVRRRPIRVDDPVRNKRSLLRKRIVNRMNKEERGQRIRVSFILAFLFLSFFVGVYAYNVEETNFDMRAYGYFSSMKAETAKEAQCTK